MFEPDEQANALLTRLEIRREGVVVEHLRERRTRRLLHARVGGGGLSGRREGIGSV
ncbi:MAG: hypothetical protein IPO67_15075 [Deltaproteobacteria bacterium]|nr:hypothetical protein [Deltaproteobacteria bacterium]